MGVNRRDTKRRLGIIVMLLVAYFSGSVFAVETDLRRVEISLSVFPRIVAVDNDFRAKLGPGRTARLLFVYDTDRSYAEELAARLLEKSGNIGGMPVVTALADVNQPLPGGDELPTAIFLAERLAPAKLKIVMHYANHEHRLVFSPFSGDVERGVTVGISVTSRVKPYFNMNTLRSSEVDINAILMKVSARYE
jgi:hypothetical protein